MSADGKYSKSFCCSKIATARPHKSAALGKEEECEKKGEKMWQTKTGKRREKKGGGEEKKKNSKIWEPALKSIMIGKNKIKIK